MAFSQGVESLLQTDTPHLRPLRRRLQVFWKQIMLLVGY